MDYEPLGEPHVSRVQVFDQPGRVGNAGSEADGDERGRELAPSPRLALPGQGLPCLISVPSMLWWVLMAGVIAVKRTEPPGGARLPRPVSFSWVYRVLVLGE